MTEIKHMLVHELDAEELRYFYKAVETDEHAGGTELVAGFIRDEIMDLWVYRNSQTLLVTVTRYVYYPDGFKEMLVAMMAGRGVTGIEAHRDIHGQLMEVAVENYCDRMVAYMKPEIYGALHKAMGPEYKPEFVVVGLYPEDVLDE